MRIKINIIYEDKFIIAVNKPSGILSITTEKEKDFTLYHLVTEYIKSRYGKNNRVFIVHRLDRDTSGVIVFAKDYNTKENLQSLFESGNVIRKYEAILSRVPQKRSGRLIRFLHIDKLGNVFISDEKDRFAKKAITDYKIVNVRNGRAFADIQIMTGKKNQIRISFSDIDCPILGDKKFNGDKYFRLALNAYCLDLRSFLDRDEYLLKIPNSFI